MSMLGIGLGGFASGFGKGIDIGKKLQGTPEEQRQRKVAGITEQGRAEFEAQGGGDESAWNDFYKRIVVPRKTATLIQSGDLEGAKQWQTWADTETNRGASRAFSEGMIAAQNGDIGGAVNKFVQAGRTRGYGADYTIGDPEPIAGGGVRINVTDKTGKSFTREFRNANEVMQFGATYLNPEAAFQSWQAQQAEARKRAGAVADDATKTRNRETIKIDADEERRRRGLPTSGAGGTGQNPADVKTAEWLLNNKIAANPQDAWRMAREARTSPETLRAQIFSRAMTPQQGQRNWEAFLKAGQASPTPARPTTTQPGPQQFREGQTATNPQTGERMIFRGGKWVPNR